MLKKWSTRSNHRSLVFDDKIWVMGGWDDKVTDDIWFSSDGISWIKALHNTLFMDRHGYSVLVFDDKMWVMGGCDDSYRNDVLFSYDGIRWLKPHQNDASWSPRMDHSCVSFNDKMWIMGGWNGKSFLNDVWSSSDGISWEEH